MDPDKTAKILLEIIESDGGAEYVRRLIASDMGGRLTTADWLDVLNALFKLREREWRGGTLH
jgi:hypothetical protein